VKRGLLCSTGRFPAHRYIGPRFLQELQESFQGGGIPEENLPKIFDPYFTTKDIGSLKGTGLGLAICHSVITRHDGAITVKSKEGVGTTFEIYLPALSRQGAGA